MHQVLASGFHQPIDTVAPHERIVSATALKRVIASTAINKVVARSRQSGGIADKKIIAAQPENPVIPGRAKKQIVEFITCDTDLTPSCGLTQFPNIFQVIRRSRLCQRAIPKLSCIGGVQVVRPA